MDYVEEYKKFQGEHMRQINGAAEILLQFISEKAEELEGDRQESGHLVTEVRQIVVDLLVAAKADSKVGCELCGG
jgi:hypothetical protein